MISLLFSTIYLSQQLFLEEYLNFYPIFRDEDRLIMNSPSPIDDTIDQSMNSEMPAWKSANQELAGILSNLRKIEHHLHCKV